MRWSGSFEWFPPHNKPQPIIVQLYIDRAEKYVIFFPKKAKKYQLCALHTLMQSYQSNSHLSISNVHVFCHFMMHTKKHCSISTLAKGQSLKIEDILHYGFQFKVLLIITLSMFSISSSSAIFLLVPLNNCVMTKRLRNTWELCEFSAKTLIRLKNQQIMLKCQLNVKTYFSVFYLTNVIHLQVLKLLRWFLW